MSEYRRYFMPGASFFFTLVAERRAPVFASAVARELLGRVMRECFRRYPIELVAIVLLPEHIHAIWTLPPGDDAYSLRWRRIKREFTRGWLHMGGFEQSRRSSRIAERRRGVWQRRFWEHMIRDEADLKAHFHYIHYNPVKHGLVERPCDWPWSTFRRWVREGEYSLDWGADVKPASLPGGAGE